MADVHVVTTTRVLVDPTGNVVDKTKASTSVVTKCSSEIRVDVAGFPTIEDYLAAEYAAGYAFKHMDQTYIITDK
jgi:hypothetical protein